MCFYGKKIVLLIWGTKKNIDMSLAGVNFSFALFLLQNQFFLQVKYIFTLGDIAQLCPARVEKRAFLLIQSIVASSVDADHRKTLEIILLTCCLKAGLDPEIL